MRLGGQVFGDWDGPEGFIRLHREAGFSACVCPARLQPGRAENREWRDALRGADITLAEVGAWGNPLSPNPEEARKAYDRLVERLALAEELEAVTYVNIIGSRHGTVWHGPHRDNFSQEFFEEAVETYRKACDAVNPRHTTLSFEMMPFNFLDGAAEYLRFLEALDRPRAAVHLDPANTVGNTRDYFHNAEHFRAQMRLLGPHVVNVHLKDLRLDPQPPVVRFYEVPIGEGGLDYPALLQMLDELDPDLPCLLEHLPDAQSYAKAAAAVRRMAGEAGVRVR